MNGVDVDSGIQGSTIQVGRTDSLSLRRWYLVLALVLLNLLDVVTTRWVLALGGDEQNPLMRPLIDHPTAPLAMKVGLCLLIGVLVMAAPRESKFPERAVGVVALAYALVVAWNSAMVIRGLAMA